MAQSILVLGGGFAGLWSAVSAARQRDALGLSPADIAITLLNRDTWHGIRVRNYEADLSPARVPLDAVLGPIDVDRIEAEVLSLDPATRSVDIRSASGERRLHCDRLVFALGSRLARPPLPGLARHAFNVDTYGAAERLQAHLQALPSLAPSPGRATVVVVGGGLTGIETAAEMPPRLRAAFASSLSSTPPRVILADHAARIGAEMGEGACTVIERALGELGVEMRPGVSIVAVDADGITLAGGERVAAATVIWCAGMQANPLTRSFPVPRDHLGRLPVDPTLKVQGLDGVFAAGDSAAFRIDGTHDAVMSCQHGRPMGRFAGHNAVCDLLGQPMLALDIPWYVTVLDLGDWGAVYTQGWERTVVATGAEAKRTKQTINGQRIYPPMNGNRREILDAAAPTVQAPPAYRPAAAR